MFMKFLRTNLVAAWILTALRIYIGWKWFSAGLGKLTGDDTFSAAGFLTGAVNNETVMNTYPTYHAFLENVALPNANVFSFLVSWGELLVGLGLILGVLTTLAAFFGIMMNFSFMFAGVVSSNPWMILITFFLLAAGYNAGRVGGDRWIIPYFREKLFKYGDPQGSAR